MPESYKQPTIFQRVIAVFTYLSMGFVGFIYLIISMARRAYLSKFMQYHIFQSIFVSLAFVLLFYIFNFLLNVLSFIPFINVITAQITMILNGPYIFGYSIIQTLTYLLLFYLAGGAALGKFTKLPWISDIINYSVR